MTDHENPIARWRAENEIEYGPYGVIVGFEKALAAYSDVLRDAYDELDMAVKIQFYLFVLAQVEAATRAAGAVDSPIYQAGRAEGRADVAAAIRAILDPADAQHWNLDGALKAVQHLKDKLDDFEDDYQHAKDEVCEEGGVDDGREHCACVPNLQRYIRELKAEQEKFCAQMSAPERTVWEAQRAEIAHLGDEVGRLRAEVEYLRALERVRRKGRAEDAEHCKDFVRATDLSVARLHLLRAEECRGTGWYRCRECARHVDGQP